MSKNKNSKSFEIALSGVCCAVAVVFLSLGILGGWLVGTGYLVGIVALMVPISRGFLKGDFFAYLGACVLTLVMGVVGRFWDLVPFIMFFGLHPLANALQMKYKINRWPALAVKAVWFDCTLIVGYYLVFGGLVGGSLFPQEAYDFVNRYIYLLIFTVGTVAFIFYDFLIFGCQRAVNGLMDKICR